MNVYEFASILGAAAWSYPISVLIYRKLIRPRIRLMPADSSELGYTAFGPIFNIQCAISTDKKDALIERIRLEITHADGDKHVLDWKFLDETQTEIRPYSGEGGGILTKYETAIALKVSTSVISLKKIGFQDDAFLKKSRDYNQKVSAQLYHLSKVSDSDYSKELLKSKEYTDMTSFFNNGMYWKVGEYAIRFLVTVVSLKKPHIETFKFRLDENNIEILKKNALQFDLLRDTILGNLIHRPAERVPQTWDWVYPKIERI